MGNKRKVAYAKLHGTEAFIPGVGQIGSTLPPTNKSMELTMYYTELGLEYTIQHGGKRYEGAFPSANLQIVVYDTSSSVSGNVLDLNKAG